VRVLVAKEINPKMEQNLNRFGIEGIETEISDISQLIASLKERLSINEENEKGRKMNFFSRFGRWGEGMGYSRRLGWGRGRRCGGRCWRWRDIENSHHSFVMGRHAGGFGFGFGFGRGAGMGFGRRDNRTRHFGKVIGRDISLLKEE
jgi:hypothetical protein